MHRISSISGWYEPLSLDDSSSLDAGAGARAGAGAGSWDISRSDSCTNENVISSELELRGPRSPIGSFRPVCSLARLLASCQSFLAQIHSASNLPKSGSLDIRCLASQGEASGTNWSTYPRIPRTCHHFVPPTTSFMTCSPRNALIRYTAASSQDDMGITRRTT
jgi:hypothetical protein